jgi:hypothetical protein
MKHFERTPLTTSMDGDFDTGNVRYKARERYSFGWSDPLGMWGSEGAGALIKLSPSSKRPSFSAGSFFMYNSWFS